MSVQPHELRGADGRPRALGLIPVSAVELTERFGWRMRGEDRAGRSIGYLSSPVPGRIVYAGAAARAETLQGLDQTIVITTSDLSDLVPEGNTCLIVPASPKEAFFSMVASLLESGQFERLASWRSSEAVVHPSATIEEGVYLEAGVVIGAGVVVHSNTYLGRDVVIKANSVVGGNGFEVAVVNGRKRVVPHAGGVWLAEGVELGSGNCVDRGVFGDFTYVGPDSKFDNLVHFAHGCHAGRDCYFTACTEISGSVSIGDGVWFGPKTTVKNGLSIGSHVFFGLGAVVTTDIPDHSLAFGFPATCRGFVCRCRSRLDFQNGTATCEQCGAHYGLSDGRVVLRSPVMGA